MNKFSSYDGVQHKRERDWKNGKMEHEQMMEYNMDSESIM